jgi:hypothetical protein
VMLRFLKEMRKKDKNAETGGEKVDDTDSSSSSSSRSSSVLI